MEVHLHNPWLTYGIGIHRMREAGLVWGLVDDMDERPLTLDEIHQFCKMFFLGEKYDLIHPEDDWERFLEGLEHVLGQQKLVYNPVAKKQTPWIDIQKLDAIYGNGERPPPSNLQQTLLCWSHQPPAYRDLYPLDHLLVTVPDLFPPNNPDVEGHEYFSRWKAFSKDSFSGCSGDELKELLERGEFFELQHGRWFVVASVF